MKTHLAPNSKITFLLNYMQMDDYQLEFTKPH